MAIPMNRENMVNHRVIIKARLCKSCYFFKELRHTGSCSQIVHAKYENGVMDAKPTIDSQSLLHLQIHSPAIPATAQKCLLNSERCLLAILLALITVNWSTLCNSTLLAQLEHHFLRSEYILIIIFRRKKSSKR